MFHIAGIDNPSDCMTKFLGYQEWIRILRPVLFWQGDMATIPTKGEWQSSTPNYSLAKFSFAMLWFSCQVVTVDRQTDPRLDIYTALKAYMYEQ